jgi:hypothetical protein
LYIRPYKSVLPSRALTVIGVGGFQPVASSREMSVFSSVAISLPFASRSSVVGGTSGFEYVSTKNLPYGASVTS